MRKTSAPGGSEVIFIFRSSPPLLAMETALVQPVKTIPITARHNAPLILLIFFLVSFCRNLKNACP